MKVQMKYNISYFKNIKFYYLDYEFTYKIRSDYV